MTTAMKARPVGIPAAQKIKPTAPITQMARVSRGNIQYYFEGNGPALLALHGSPAGCDQSVLLYQDFVDHGFSLLAPSRPGFLGTAIELGQTIAEQAESIIELVDYLGISEFFIAGFSCGAATTVRLAAQYPHRVKGVILEAPVTKSFEHTSIRGLHGQLLLSELGSWILKKLVVCAPLYSIKRLLERESTYGLGLRLEARKIFEDETKRNYAIKLLGHCMPASQRLRGLLNDARQLANFANDDLKKVVCPTLLIHGLCDGEVPFSHSEHAASIIKNSRLLAVPDACHLLCLADRWELVKKARRRFLKAIVDNAADPFQGISMR